MTHITSDHKALFQALVSGAYDNFALVSCFADGKPTVAIASITRDGATYCIEPHFIAPVDGQILTDHDGVPVTPRNNPATQS